MNSADEVHRSILRIAQHSLALEEVLNAADRQLGDGDTGTMLVRLIAAMAITAPAPKETLSGYLFELGKSGQNSTGSSLGTLLVMGMMTAAQRLKDESVTNNPAELLRHIREAMQRIGRSDLGAKTILDSLAAIEAKLKIHSSSHVDKLKLAHEAAVDALDEFRMKPSHIGRARIYAEKSIGKDDPGMLAIAKILEILGDGGLEHPANNKLSSSL